MLKRTPPILFCHYGNSKYLRYVLPCAVYHNPDRQVVLLGDDSNRQTALNAGAYHIPYRLLEYGDDLATFSEVYRELKGVTSTANSFWLNFVFKRWFLIANLLDREEVQQFWHFDSDNMLVEPLSEHEHYFQSLDCTDQCNGSCLNGFVANAAIVRRFVHRINRLFQDENFLLGQQNRIAGDPRSHFNEMVAYANFKLIEKPKTERLFQIRDDMIFDDAICHCEQFESETLRTGESMKRLMVSDDGRFYGFVEHQADRVPIRFASLNLSWVPLYVYRNVYHHSLNRTDTPSPPPNERDLSPFRDLPIPISQFLKYRFRRATRSIRHPFKNLWGKISG